MNIIIPMAGLGKRLRPHTLTTPKPLLPIAGKPIVHRLVEDIRKVCPEKVERIGFVIHPDFGAEVETSLKKIAAQIGAEGRIYYQEQAMGISHALLYARELFTGKVIVAFADTLIKADFKIDTTRDGVIFVQQVNDPTQFGVVSLNNKKEVTGFVEKPSTFVSDLAIIGIYYFRDGESLAREMQYLLDHDIREKGEYQFTTALENLRKKGAKFTTERVTEWLDCGNKAVTVESNARYLEFLEGTALFSPSARTHNSVVIPPVYLGEGVVLENSVVGPHVSVGDKTLIKDSRVARSLIQNHCIISNANLTGSLLGNYTVVEGKPDDLNLGDYSGVA
jgi:glucose-1-phosphate thymidylyltransferase